MRAPRWIGVFSVTVLGASLTVFTSAWAAVGGGASWIAMALAALTVAIMLGTRMPLALAASATATSALVVVLGVLMLAHALGFSFAAGLAVAGSAAALISVPLAWRRRSARFRADRRTALVGAASLIGPAAWGLWLAAVRGGDPLERVAWAVGGDGLNNLTYTRMLLGDGGIAVGANTNPMPLPVALVALVADPGRTDLSGAGLLVHDLSAFAQSWVLLAMVVMITAGLAAASLSRALGAGATMSAAVAGVVSIASTGWIALGYMVEYGFLSIAVVIGLIFTGVLASRHVAAHPAVALGALAMTTTAVLATWAPLATIPAATALVLALGRVRQILATRGAAAVFLIASLVLSLAYALGVVLPVYLREKSALLAAGGIVELPRWWVFAAVGLLAGLGILAWRRSPGSPAGPIATATAAAGLGSLGALLFASRWLTDPWSYYPVKIAWVVILIDGVLVVGMLVGLAMLPGRAPVVVRAVTLVVAVVLPASAVVWTPAPEWNGFEHRSAWGRVAADPTDMTEKLELVAEGVDPAAAVLPWDTGDDDVVGTAVIWLTQLWQGTLAGDQSLRIAGLYAYTDHSASVLCRIVELAPQPLTVVSPDPTLADDLLDECPGAPSPRFITPEGETTS